MRNVISCDVLPCSLVDIYRRFRETHSLLVKGIYTASNVGKFLPEEMTSFPKKTVICVVKGIHVYIYIYGFIYVFICLSITAYAFLIFLSII